MAVTVLSNVSWDQDAWEKLAYFDLRPQLYYDQVATVRGENVTADGSPTVKFVQTHDLAVASSTINESTDITPVALSDAIITVTLAEYGNAAQTTAAVRGESFIPVDPVLANIIGYNAGLSLDDIAKTALQAGSNVVYSTGTGTLPTGRSSVTPLNTITAADVRYATAKLRGANVQPNNANLYTAYIHPDVTVDLRGVSAGTGANWRDPHAYSAPENIWIGELGAFEGVRFIETPRAPLFADSGSSTTLTDVYGTLFCGQQALAKGYSKMDGNGPLPRLAPTPVTDTLRRFTGMGWYWLGGYARFREAALYRVESASSIGKNS